jgi:phage-related protein
LNTNFQLIDLASQAGAVQKLLEGKTETEIVAWISQQGQIEPIPKTNPEYKQVYRFTSQLAIEALFFFHDGKLAFISDHTAFTVG